MYGFVRGGGVGCESVYVDVMFVCMKVKRKIVHRKLKIREESELRKKRGYIQNQKRVYTFNTLRNKGKKKKENRKPE